jgi:hypothetical protein
MTGTTVDIFVRAPVPSAYRSVRLDVPLVSEIAD